MRVHDAFVGGKYKGKRGRGAQGKTPVIIACENKHKKAGFIVIGNVKTFLLGTFHGVTDARNRLCLPKNTSSFFPINA
jgi:hypothetical protein